MSATEDGLGGPLKLADPDSLTGAQRELFDHITANAVAWADRSGFAATTAGGRLIGPFNPSLLNPQIATAFLTLQSAEEQNTSLDERSRQVVILTVGAVWQAPYELYAHSAVARRAGLSDAVIASWLPAACRTASRRRRRPPTDSPRCCRRRITSTTISPGAPSRH